MDCLALCGAGSRLIEVEVGVDVKNSLESVFALRKFKVWQNFGGRQNASPMGYRRNV